MAESSEGQAESEGKSVASDQLKESEVADNLTVQLYFALETASKRVAPQFRLSEDEREFVFGKGVDRLMKMSVSRRNAVEDQGAWAWTVVKRLSIGLRGQTSRRRSLLQSIVREASDGPLFIPGMGTVGPEASEESAAQVLQALLDAVRKDSRPEDLESVEQAIDVLCTQLSSNLTVAQMVAQRSGYPSASTMYKRVQRLRERIEVVLEGPEFANHAELPVLQELLRSQIRAPRKSQRQATRESVTAKNAEQAKNAKQDDEDD